MGDTHWQAGIANDSPNGFKFSDAYETHTMYLARYSDSGWVTFSAALVAPERPEDIDDDFPANRAFGELLTIDMRRNWRSDGTKDYSFGGAVTLIGEFGLDNVQEEIHSLLGYRSVRDELRRWRMDDALLVSGFITERRPFGRYQIESEIELGSRRNALATKLSRTTNCEGFGWEYMAQLELVANDEVVSADPVGADIRHIVPTLGVGFCTNWRGFAIRFSEEVSLPRIKNDDNAYPMVRVSIGF